MHPSDAEMRDIITHELIESDIVWPKYGTDTVQKLTERILSELKRGKFHILDDGDYHELAGTFD
jgi:hypothetical protein